MKIRSMGKEHHKVRHTDMNDVKKKKKSDTDHGDSKSENMPCNSQSR